MEIVIASRNLGKIREFREMLGVVPNLDINSLLSFPNYAPPEETGSTFVENAELKAIHAAKSLNKYVLADDSGLVVPGLNGDPGPRSRRYAGEEATDRENRQKLLRDLADKKGLGRQAFFECTLIVAGPEGVLKKVVGLRISEERRAESGER